MKQYEVGSIVVFV